MMDIETKLERNGNSPGRVPSIPSIFLNTTDKAEICLHTPDNDNQFPFRRPYHVSLPDLSGTNIPHIITSSSKSPLTENPNSPNSPNTKEDKIVGVYCSPRSSRRGLDKFSESADAIANAGKNENGFCWLNTFDPTRSYKRKQRQRHSSSTSSSEETVKSASHMSTCGSRSRLGHFDRLSLPEMSSLGSVHLRRVYSGPITQATLGQEDISDMPPRREVKSCSNLSSYDKYSTNFFYSQMSSNSNLLSPPSVLPSLYVNPGSTPSMDDLPGNLEDSVNVGERKTFEQMYEEAYRKVHQHCLQESRNEKQNRIQQWLKNLSDGTCSAGQSHESTEG